VLLEIADGGDLLFGKRARDEIVRADPRGDPGGGGGRIAGEQSTAFG